jgi:hypothetical protein
MPAPTMGIAKLTSVLLTFSKVPMLISLVIEATPPNQA